MVLVIVVAVLAFLAISALLARVFSVDGAERSAITGLVQAEAHGDLAGMLSRMHDCGPACGARVRADALELRRAGAVSVLQIQPSAGFSLGGTLGTARVAWRAGGSLPVVQCVRVRRAGNALSGLTVELLDLSRRIKSDADCPAQF